MQRTDPLGLSELVFSSGAGTLTVFPGNGVMQIQQFPAGNNASNPGGGPLVPNSFGPAPNGTFPVGPFIATGNDPNSGFGTGFFRIELPVQIPYSSARSGVGIHSGRKNIGGPTATTNGCVRTTDDAINYLRIDPPTRITIQP